MQRNLWEEFKAAFRKSNNALIQLILINGIIFFLLRSLEVILLLSGVFTRENADLYHQGYLDIMGLPSGLGQVLLRPWTIVTTFFTHYGFWHILSNMLFLYWFGRIIKEFLGNAKLVNLYILGGLAGGIAYVVMYNIVPLYSSELGNSALIGASASVMAIVVGAATLMPNYTFSLILLGPIRIIYIAIFFVVMHFFGTIGGNSGGNIAHLGGALIGYFYVRQLQKGTDWGKWVQSTLDFFKSFFVRTNVRVTHRKSSGKKSKSAAGPAPKKGSSSEVPQEEIDAILDKISAKGYESLTKDEKQKLFNASK